MLEKTIEQQVAELTPQQKNSIKDIYKKFIIVYVVVLVIGIIVSAASFMFVSMKLEQAQERYERLETQQAINEMNGTFDFALSDEKMEAIDEYYDLKPIRVFSLLTGPVVILIGTGVILVVFKSKYPYFSEKKYTYLKKVGYFNNPMQ